MNFAKSIHLSFLLLLIFTTFLALAGIRGFLRLAPSIEQINQHNTQSLYYAENMLSALSVKRDIVLFEKALTAEKQNITESGEAEIIKKIESTYKQAFAGNKNYEEKTVDNIIALSKVNRLAMKEAALNAQKLSSAGSWVIAFITILIWGLGFIIMKKISRNVIKPIFELKDVFESYCRGNKLRRCPKIAPTKDFQAIYDSVNNLLDKQ